MQPPLSPPPHQDKQNLWKKVRPLFSFSDRKRPWGFLVTAALAVGLPVIIGTWFGYFSLGVVASGGGLASLYLRQTPLPHRLITMALATFGFCTCFALCLTAGFSDWAVVAAIGFVTFWATFICRYFAVPPPGNFLFVLMACIASAIPYDLSLVAERTGLLFFGCLGACTLTLTYSLMQMLGAYTVDVYKPEPTEPRVVAIVLESATLAIFVAASYLFALGLGFNNPYWAPISCAAIMQGDSFRAVWHRKVHRIVGTTIGMGLAWLVFSFNPGQWTMALLILGLSLVIEMLVTRNYGLAVIFITPLTIILTEGQHMAHDVNATIILRLIDVVLGSTVGYVGGWVLHHRGLFDRLEQRLLQMGGK